MCACMYVHVPNCTCGGPKIICESQFFSSLVLLPGVELRGQPCWQEPACVAPSPLIALYLQKQL